VHCHQFTEGAVGLDLVVDHPVADAPTVLATFVDLDLDWLRGAREGLTQLVFSIGLALIVVGRDGGIVVGLDLGARRCGSDCR
jgi:hypothetical protein